MVPFDFSVKFPIAKLRKLLEMASKCLMVIEMFKYLIVFLDDKVNEQKKNNLQGFYTILVGLIWMTASIVLAARGSEGSELADYKIIILLLTPNLRKPSKTIKSDKQQYHSQK